MAAPRNIDEKDFKLAAVANTLVRTVEPYRVNASAGAAVIEAAAAKTSFAQAATSNMATRLPNKHALYLLANDDAKSLAEVQQQLRGKHAVLIYPNPKTTNGEQQSFFYKACFLQNGQLITQTVASKERIIEVEIVMNKESNSRISIVKNKLPCDITQLIPNAVELIQKARARISNCYSLFAKTSTSIMQNKVLPYLDTPSLSSFSRNSFHTRQLTQPEFDQRALRKLFEYIRNGEASDLFLMKLPNSHNRLDYEKSNERHLYLYKEQDKTVFYYYKENPDKFNSSKRKLIKCHDNDIRKVVFDMTSKQSHTQCDDEEKIKQMLTSNPGLAVVRWKARNENDKIITNRAGQHIYVENKTALQFALGEEWDPAIAMLKASILTVADEKELIAQYRAQFAKGWEQEEEQRCKAILPAQEKLAKAIQEAAPDDIKSSGLEKTLTIREGSDVAKADAEFRALLDAALQIPVKMGRHFNPQPLQTAVNVYPYFLTTHFDHCEDPRAMLLWRRNVGYNQRMMSIGYVHAFCDAAGFHENVSKKDVQPSSSLTLQSYHLGYRYWVPAGFYPLAGLGFNFAIDGDGHKVQYSGRRSGMWLHLRNYVDQKLETYKTYAAATARL